MPTVQEIHDIWPIARVLASNDVSNGQLFGAPINPLIAIQIELIGYAVDYRYELEDIEGGSTPSASLTNTSNYLFSWCGKYGLIALGLINSGGIIPGTTPSTVIYSIPISSSYTAVANGETTMTLKDADGNDLPTGTRVVQVFKSLAWLNPNDYSYTYPTLELLNGISMSADEVLSFLYVVPV